MRYGTDYLVGAQPNDVKREVAELMERRELWRVDTTGSIDSWIDESHELAKSVVYSPEIVAAVKAPDELQPITLPREYLQGMGEFGRARIIAAGVRLAAVLESALGGEIGPSIGD